MNLPLPASVALNSASGVLNLYLCLYVYFRRYRYKDIAYFFMAYTITISIYCFASAIMLLSSNLEQIKFWTTIQYIGMPVSTTLGLLFVMHYLGIHLSKLKVILLLIIPFMTTLIVATNDLHYWHYKILELDPLLGAPYVYQEIGIWYMVHGTYIFSCMLVALLLALSRWKETAPTHRLELLSLILGQFIPMLTALLYLFELTPRGIDPVPMILWLSSLLYLWSISSSRMFTLMPIAKNIIFNSINDGVMVLDESLQLNEFNQICETYFPKLTSRLVGANFYTVWQELTGRVFPLELCLTGNKQETQITIDSTKRIYQIRISPLIEAKNRKGLLLIFTDVTEVRALQEKLEHQANYDELTQIYNRRAFLKQCESDLYLAEQGFDPFTVILVDIDYFKKVNDTYGHHTGDQLLQHVVHLFKSQLTDGQIFARYGGEEFALYLKGYSARDAEALGNHLRQLIETHALISPQGNIPVTLSMGVAEAIKGAKESVDQLLKKADHALYIAKESGRNQVAVYSVEEEL